MNTGNDQHPGARGVKQGVKGEGGIKLTFTSQDTIARL